MKDTKVLITKADSVYQWTFDRDDIQEIHARMLDLTDFDLEIADEAVRWVLDAPLGANYAFREGWIDMVEV